MLPWMTKPQSKNIVCSVPHDQLHDNGSSSFINQSCNTPEKIHSRVKTWTRRVDLFLKDYIILPVCERWVHVNEGILSNYDQK